jgi:hypothetical protein
MPERVPKYRRRSDVEPVAPDTILAPHRATVADVILWAGLLVVALAGATALFGGAVRDLIVGGGSGGPGGAGGQPVGVPTSAPANPGQK